MTNALTVGELLSAMGIEPDWNDEVSSPLQTPISVPRRIRFVDVVVRRDVVETTIPHGWDITYTDELAPGERIVDQEGSDGLSRRTFRVRIEDGRVVSRRLVETMVVTAPVEQRIRMGQAPDPSPSVGSQVGEASWYWSSGMNAAHPWLPFGTVVTVTNLDNGKSVTVTINDRGPFGGRIIDLSDEAFAQIAPLSQGVCQVRLEW
ncbi:MAG: G5 domain-containing protein [Actinobacteria bacterium]|nr:G5 domain-containing protein [Actinomycetota bacterium]